MDPKPPEMHALPTKIQSEEVALSQFFIQKIDPAQLLDDTGIRFPFPKILKIFVNHGAELVRL
jgi:hypothetical protein